MNSVDDDIRSLLGDALAGASNPLAAADIVERSTEVRLNPVALVRPARSRVWMVATLSAAVLLLAVMLVGRATQLATSEAADPTRPMRYFLPTWLPEGYVLLDAEEVIGPDGGSPARAIYSRTDPPARLEISAYPVPAGYEYLPVNNTPLHVDGGYGSWSWIGSGSVDQRGVALDVLRGDMSFEMQAIGIPSGSVELSELAGQISIGSEGVPIVDPSSGFVEEASSVAESPALARSYGLTYGLPGTAGQRLYIVVRRLPTIVDPGLAHGIYSTKQSIDGRDVWVPAGGHSITWMAEDDLEVSVFGSGPPGAAREVFAGLNETTEDRFAVTLGRVADGRAADEQWSVTLDGRPVLIEQIGSGSSFWLCLSETPGPRRCSLTEPSTDERGEIHTVESFVRSSRWYVMQGHGEVGITEATARATTSDNQWDVMVIADGTPTVNSAWRLDRPLR